MYLARPTEWEVVPQRITDRDLRGRGSMVDREQERSYKRSPQGVNETTSSAKEPEEQVSLARQKFPGLYRTQRKVQRADI